MTYFPIQKSELTNVRQNVKTRARVQYYDRLILLHSVSSLQYHCPSGNRSKTGDLLAIPGLDTWYRCSSIQNQLKFWVPVRICQVLRPGGANKIFLRAFTDKRILRSFAVLGDRICIIENFGRPSEISHVGI